MVKKRRQRKKRIKSFCSDEKQCGKGRKKEKSENCSAINFYSIIELWTILKLISHISQQKTWSNFSSWNLILCLHFAAGTEEGNLRQMVQAMIPVVLVYIKGAWVCASKRVDVLRMGLPGVIYAQEKKRRENERKRRKSKRSQKNSEWKFEEYCESDGNPILCHIWFHIWSSGHLHGTHCRLAEGYSRFAMRDEALKSLQDMERGDGRRRGPFRTQLFIRLSPVFFCVLVPSRVAYSKATLKYQTPSKVKYHLAETHHYQHHHSFRYLYSPLMCNKRIRSSPTCLRRHQVDGGDVCRRHSGQRTVGRSGRRGAALVPRRGCGAPHGGWAGGRLGLFWYLTIILFCILISFRWSEMLTWLSYVSFGLAAAFITTWRNIGQN